MLYSEEMSNRRTGSSGDWNEHRPLGQLLIEQYGLSPEQLAKALDRQRALAERHRYYLLGRILISLGYVSSHQLYAALALQNRPGPTAELDAAQTFPRLVADGMQGPEPWQVPTNSGVVRPISALHALHGLAERVDAGDLEGISPVPLGFDPLDEALGGGVRPGELVLIGGGHGVGKTTLALQMARNIAASGEASCLFVSYEDDEESLAQRLIAMESVDLGSRDLSVGVSVHDLTRHILAAHHRGNVALFDLLESNPRTSVALQRLRRYGDRLHLLKGSSRTTLTALADLVEAYRVRNDRRLVLFVDYLQKIPVSPEAMTERERIGMVVSGLKEIALSQQIPVVPVVASDLDGLRAKRMRAHHLLGGSLLVYEADIILMLAEKYDAVARVHLEFNPQKAQSYRDWVICSVEKNRSGRNVADMQFEKLFSYSCLNPNGSYVTEKLIDERLYVE
ncbi:MAG: DnaB-like helicase C-terminal domain-containing protein [Chloroflexota bacterium]|jgi:replicative DNA helicase